jgi:hypothetical protein
MTVIATTLDCKTTPDRPHPSFTCIHPCKFCVSQSPAPAEVAAAFLKRLKSSIASIPSFVVTMICTTYCRRSTPSVTMTCAAPASNNCFVLAEVCVSAMHAAPA